VVAQSSLTITVTKGHGTANDFVLFQDPEDALNLSPAQYRQLADRHRGVGGDGVIRVTRTAATPEVAHLLEVEPEAQWFMDYRNADGSLAEMCGNGIRVMARYLVERGHQPEGIFPINTRDGVKHLRVPLTDDISVNMGQVTDEGESVTAATNGHIWNGYNISVGNPHAVVFVDDMTQIGELSEAPVVRPRDSYPEGVNVEFVKITEGNSIQMRVYERGSGETRSCGTGTCAVALAATLHTKGKLPATWIINPPGGRLEVSIDGHSNATLTGPAVLIRDVDISEFLLG
jgi:diaminopimelate epimerase